MVRVFREQADFLREEEAARADGVISQKEQAKLRTNLEALRADMQRIAPPAPLTWKEWLVRGGVVAVALAVVSVVVMERLHLIPVFVRTETTGEAGDATARRYIPVTATAVLDFPLVNVASSSDPVTVSSSFDLTDHVVGVVPENGGVTALYVSMGETRHALKRQLFGLELQVRGAAQNVVEDQDVEDASVVEIEGGYLLAVSVKTEGGSFLVVKRLDADWNVVSEPLLFRPLEDETFLGLGLFLTGNADAPYALVTKRDPGEEASISNTRQLVLRTVSPSFELAAEEVLETPDMNVDSRASYFPSTQGEGDAGFALVTNGGSPFESDGVQKGDDLFALVFNGEREPTEYFRLTNNGRPHDFWPAGGVTDANGYRYVPYVRQQIPPLADRTGQYYHPDGSGNLFVGIFDGPTWRSIGTIFIGEFDPQPQAGGEARVGGTSPRVLKIGTRLFAFYDVVTVEDPYDERDSQSVTARWFELNK